MAIVRRARRVRSGRFQFHLAADTWRWFGHGATARIARLRQRTLADGQRQNVGDSEVRVLLGHRIETTRQGASVQEFLKMNDP
jgi:hypothetical protein